MTFEQRLKELIRVAACSDKGVDEPKKFAQWRMQAIWFLVQNLGPEHPYTLEFITHVAHISGKETPFSESRDLGQGILQALWDDHANGHIKIKEPE